MKKKIDKARRNTIIIGVFIVVLMIGSVLALYASPYSDRTSKARYNGFDFILTEQGWTVWLANQPVPFTYLPFDLENLTLPGNINRDAEKVYIVAENKDDLNSDYALRRIKSVLYIFTKMRFVDACITEKNCPEEMPVIKCDEISSQAIVFAAGNETRSYKDYQCLVFQFRTFNQDQNASNSTADRDVYKEMDKTTEKIIYKILGIAD